jgi:RNA polymerase sigma factor (TIGR02999 family)
MSNPETTKLEITQLLDALCRGEMQSHERLIPILYAELRKLAGSRMAREASGHTLQPTGLVNEAWLRIFGRNDCRWENRAHFFAAAGEAMRRILVENARRKKRLKRGGQLHRVDVDEVTLATPMPDEDLLALDEALQRLAAVDPRAGGVVNLCFFVGLTQEQAAKELGLSLSTVERTWAFARAWLFREIQKMRSPSI